MTTYPLESMLESGLSLLVLLGLYKLLLENQPMHRLKRAYLLSTLAVSLMGPLITLEVPLGTLPVVTSLSNQQLNQAYFSTISNVHQQSAVANVPAAGTSMTTVWHWLYTAGTLLMLVRFGRNLHRLARQIRMNPTQPFRGVVLVRLPGEGLPYTFLHYLFVPNAAYQRGEIDGELFTHELAHIRQRHSLDVLLVELILCFGWFNPLLFWLKRAVQLNHEFLADEAVNHTYHNVAGYQKLLLSKLTCSFSAIPLISTLTFQTTKQRLTMMTKHASPIRTGLVAGATALLFSTMTLLLTTRTEAQQARLHQPQKQALKPSHPRPT